MDRWKAEMGRVREKKRREEKKKKDRRRDSQKKKIQVREKVRVAKRCVFPMVRGPGGSNSIATGCCCYYCCCYCYYCYDVSLFMFWLQHVVLVPVVPARGHNTVRARLGSSVSLWFVTIYHYKSKLKQDAPIIANEGHLAHHIVENTKKTGVREL